MDLDKGVSISYKERVQAITEFRAIVTDPFLVIMKITQALAIIHDQGCVHSCLSLDCILLDTNERVKL